MEKTLYLMRHGETLFNEQKKIQGWCDSPLTEKGQAQAREARKYFEKNQIELQSAYSSTSERACDTLELVTDLPYQRKKGLKEWNFGRMEAEHEYLNPPLPYKDFFVAYGGEEEIAFRNRMADTVMQIMKEEKNDTVLIVSHGAACRQFMRAWEHNTTVDLHARLKNCGILKFHFDGETFELLEIHNEDFSHLE